MQEYVPSVGEMVPVQLGSELVRAPVSQVLENNDLVVTLTQEPFMAAAHGYHRGAELTCRRSTDILAGNRWEVLRDVG